MSETRQGWAAGPWTYEPAIIEDHEYTPACVTNGLDDNDHDFSIICRISDMGPERERAHGYLIAAVPDLVEALEAMLTLDNRDNGNQMADAITDMARAALARAKGE